MKTLKSTGFGLEWLEPRTLLSGVDPAAAVAADGTVDATLITSAEEVKLPDPAKELNPDQIFFDPSAEINAIFEKLPVVSRDGVVIANPQTVGFGTVDPAGGKVEVIPSPTIINTGIITFPGASGNNQTGGELIITLPFENPTGVFPGKPFIIIEPGTGGINYSTGGSTTLPPEGTLPPDAVDRYISDEDASSWYSGTTGTLEGTAETRAFAHARQFAVPAVANAPAEPASAKTIQAPGAAPEMVTAPEPAAESELTAAAAPEVASVDVAITFPFLKVSAPGKIQRITNSDLFLSPGTRLPIFDFPRDPSLPSGSATYNFSGSTTLPPEGTLPPPDVERYFTGEDAANWYAGINQNSSDAVDTTLLQSARSFAAPAIATSFGQTVRDPQAPSSAPELVAQEELTQLDGTLEISLTEEQPRLIASINVMITPPILVLPGFPDPGVILIDPFPPPVNFIPLPIEPGTGGISYDFSGSTTLPPEGTLPPVDIERYFTSEDAANWYAGIGTLGSRSSN